MKENSKGKRQKKKQLRMTGEYFVNREKKTIIFAELKLKKYTNNQNKKTYMNI